MKNKYMLFLLVLGFSLLLAACSSDSKDVPSLAATPIPNVAEEERDNETLMMEFAECLRNEGLEVADPMVDADGNIQFPEIIDENGISKEEWWAACSPIVENITFEKEEVDRSAQLEQYLKIAACMNEAGFDIGEPTAETLYTWMDDLKNTFDWDDPDAEEAIEACFGGVSDGKGKGDARK